MKTLTLRAWLCISIAAMLLISACSGGGGGNGGAVGSLNTGSNTGEGKTASGEVITVNMWGWNPGGAVAEELFNAFNASHTDIQVKYTQAEYNDYLNNLKLNMMSGEGPDLFGIQAGEMMVQYGEFMEVLDPLAEQAWGQNWKEKFYDLGIQQMQTEEGVKAMPFFMSAAGYLWYNKTLLDEKGVQPPETFDEWVQVSKQLNEGGLTPFLQGAKDAWINFDTFLAIANDIAPGKIYEAEAGTVPWTDADLLKAMEYWKRMFTDGIMQKGALGISQYPDTHDKWAKGESAMIMLGTWNNDHMTRKTINNMKTTLGISDDYQFMPLAFPDVNGDGKPGRLFGGPDVAWALNKDAKNKEAAWKVLQWYESEEAQTILAKYLSVPALKGVDLDESDIMFEDQKEMLKKVMSDLDNSVGKREFLYPELKTALSDALQTVASGASSPEDAMKNVEQVSKGISR